MKIKILYLISILLLSSCATYYMTPQSLQAQLKNGDPATSFNNNLTQVKCVDKDGMTMF